MRRFLGAALFLAFFSLFSATVACAGLLSLPDIADKVINVGTSVAKAARPITPEEEYYIGRSVAARILGSYKLLNNDEFTRYVNLAGQAVAFHSEMPFTYGGYHFAILDSKEINAFACPGGIIFITKGMIDLAVNEDQLAAILAHEVAHINHKDGLGAIQSSRMTDVVTVIGTEAAKQYTSGQVAQLLNIFEGSIDDVFKSLVTSGYSKSQEYAADESAIVYLKASGYNPAALKDVLANLQTKSGESGGGILKTHPSASDRISAVSAKLTEAQVSEFFDKRTKRFSDHYGKFSK
ncbi:MAG: M48 family metalloprotease [Candidatus Magnetominusculus sp. LBB02]|nr:M48 family metalloprotease [Candidatus Magnetominusculus sp. LBB02]